MGEHELKAVQDTFERIVGGGRVDIRQLPAPENAIFKGDTINYIEVDADSREPTGRKYSIEVVKTSLHFPGEFNTAEELAQINVLGLEAKTIIYPVEDAAVMLKAGANLYSVISAGEHNIDIRASREEIAGLEPGAIVGYEFTDKQGKTHTVGRKLYKNDFMDLAGLYGDGLGEVLDSGFLVLGLAREGDLTKAEE